MTLDRLLGAARQEVECHKPMGPETGVPGLEVDSDDDP